ncbi:MULTISPECIES: autotransporter outer membrane beta-barrel domain-containing protein [unclassified Bartonella]|uniref:autotransporter outer membrane beta-barrel domain-containing protein n=1 Tax=unclassified Bartonella TaxID=2645622 RepID=UPI0009992D78|nr:MULTISPECIES: autotransporter outer membrane beta-barrel domain-containing protein [unclassified Bartonella]AQX27739.1 outer membrane autotransporter barrel domain-containing protein [Bartonella sp. JB15]AQX29021.1 outer membrane autotransporter barrel domain-containing protein [Bartonella sp. JB63]
MSKNYLLYCTTVAAVILFGTNFARAENSSFIEMETLLNLLMMNQALFVDEGKTIVMESGAIKTEKNGVHAQGSGSKIELGDVRIEAKNGLFAQDNNTIIMKKGSIKASENGVQTYNSGSKIELGDVWIEAEEKGLIASENSTITMEKGSIKTKKNGVHAQGSGSKIKLGDVQIEAEEKGLIAFKNSTITMEKGSIKTKKNGVHAQGSGSKIELGDVRIEAEEKGLIASENSTITMEKASIKAKETAVEAQKSGVRIELSDVRIEAEEKGLIAFENSTITMEKGSIKTKKNGVHAQGSGSKIKLGDVQIEAEEKGLIALKNSTIIMEKASIKAKETAVETQDSGSRIELTDAKIEAGKTGVSVYDESTIIMERGSIKAKENGIETQGSGSRIKLTNVQIEAKKTGILLVESGQSNILLKDSRIHADVLLNTETAYDEATLELSANHSLLEGGVRTGEETETVFNLNNGTIWTLKISKEEKNDENKLLDLGDRARSFVSKLDLNNSTIAFDKSTEGQYQTLYVGPVIPEVIDNRRDANNPSKVYNAQGNAKIYFNTEWISGLKIKDQKTDRLVINGDASGTTTVYVNIIKGNNKTEENTSVPENENGISLIQVSGKANKDSFKLAHGYTTIKGVPYKYTLNAYDPKASSHKADQSMFGPDTPYWDFRLQNAYLDSQSKVKALVPQMASYLVMPNALFSVGFSDIGEQNKALTNMRTISLENDNNKKNTFFLSSYGSTVTLSSNHSALEYGYGANIRYGGVQAGVALGALENQNTITRFGLLGTYGQVSFTPKDMEGAVKSTLDKWSVSAFGSMQYRNGLYLDTLFSYGLVKGHIKVADIGNIAKLDNVNTLSASATIGQQFTTSIQGLTFEPQAQLAYQSLIFDNISDGNDLEINMNNPHQWLVRIGGRLTKTVTAVENGRAISLYGKLNMINTFGDDNTIQVSDSFHLDPMGASVEGGVGINAQLNQKIGLHGDVSHQHKLQKAGVSATSFSGGIRYRF